MIGVFTHHSHTSLNITLTLTAKGQYGKTSKRRVLRGGGGGVQVFHFGKNDFELEVGGDGQDTSRNFEGIFGLWSIRAILPN